MWALFLSLNQCTGRLSAPGHCSHIHEAEEDDDSAPGAPAPGPSPSPSPLFSTQWDTAWENSSLEQAQVKLFFGQKAPRKDAQAIVP